MPFAWLSVTDRLNMTTQATTINKTLARNLANAKANGVDNMATITRILSAVRQHNATDELVEALGEDGIKINAEMAEQCRKWLLGLHYTPTGKEKASSPLGYRELAIAEDFDRATWAASRAVNNYGATAAVFNVYGKNGNYFQYFMQGGQIHIIG